MQAQTPELVRQRTIAQRVESRGIGLHSGKEVVLSLEPADSDHGIVFQRTDLADAPLIPMKAELIKDTMMSSNLVVDGTKVGTVEHLLSAIAAFAIDNLLVKVSAPEMPIMDGSAKEFVELIEQAGIKEQEKAKKFLKICKPIKVIEEDKWCELLPCDKSTFELNFEIQFDHPAIASTPQTASFELTTDNFINQLANARTFGFLKDIEYLRANNLALGGSLDNAIVVDEDKIVNEEGLRLDDEFVRHKILDAIGDLYVIGSPLLGQYNAYKSGHALNNTLIKQVLADEANYEFVYLDAVHS